MAGACCKCPVSLSVFKRSLAVAPRGGGSAPRSHLLGWRVGERGLQEVARPSSALRPAGFYRHTGFLCLSYQESMSESLRTCYLYLNQTSRSFAAVIQALDGELRWVQHRAARGGVSACMDPYVLWWRAAHGTLALRLHFSANTPVVYFEQFILGLAPLH